MATLTVETAEAYLGHPVHYEGKSGREHKAMVRLVGVRKDKRQGIILLNKKEIKVPLSTLSVWKARAETNTAEIRKREMEAAKRVPDTGTATVIGTMTPAQIARTAKDLLTGRLTKEHANDLMNAGDQPLVRYILPTDTTRVEWGYGKLVGIASDNCYLLPFQGRAPIKVHVDRCYIREEDQAKLKNWDAPEPPKVEPPKPAPVAKVPPKLDPPKTDPPASPRRKSIGMTSNTDRYWIKPDGKEYVVVDRDAGKVLSLGGYLVAITPTVEPRKYPKRYSAAMAIGNINRRRRASNCEPMTLEDFQAMVRAAENAPAATKEPEVLGPPVPFAYEQEQAKKPAEPEPAAPAIVVTPPPEPATLRIQPLIMQTAPEAKPEPPPIAPAQAHRDVAVAKATEVIACTSCQGDQAEQFAEWSRCRMDEAEAEALLLEATMRKKRIEARMEINRRRAELGL